MDAIEAIMSRRSIRNFKPGEDIAEEDLMIILDAGRMAPNAGNLQPLYFVAIKDPEQKEKIKAAAFEQELLGTAPVIIAVCVDPERSSKYGEKGRNYFSSLDAANATENMLLAAHALGYGGCWVGGFEPRRVHAILGLPDDFRVVSLVPLGHPASLPEAPPRRTLNEILRYDRW